MKMIRAGVMLAVAMGAVVCPPPPAYGQAAMMVSALQVKDDLFAGTEKFAVGASDVSEVNLDKNMLGMAGKGKDGLASKMDFIVVHSYTYDKPGMYKLEDVEAYRKKLTDGSWNCFIHTRDKDESTDICQRTMPDNETHEMVIMTAEPKELTFVHLRGRMSLKDLGDMGSGMGIGAGAGAGAGAGTPPAKKHDD
jgi:Domain of unknown function (DUF4252)